ncbi:TlpA family protein disulfide reductase [Vibrio sp. SS-MA-C1-2]|uniref:TlpA family protein disulfide reductase n=1 Tax=Vibrio sp. SS-MA-C1-2 TaxID=2908646 RepID=UPI001F2FA823|nr:TlpA disulfide reductase family protein [Vibrio sp. SS-MA-C1-2]UJF17278.1 TlpA family protein disulfide reductase [Vibrio sp. SS-MA-C1-2]
MKKTLKFSYLLFSFLLLVSGNSLASNCPTPEGFQPIKKGMVWENTTKQITLINLWAVWCPPCLKELPMLDKVASYDSFSVEAIHLGDNPEAIDTRFKDLNITHLKKKIEPEYSQLQKWGFQGLPATMVVINNQVTFTYSGYIKHGSHKISQWLNCLANEQS